MTDKHMTPFVEVKPMPPTMGEVQQMAKEMGRSVNEVQDEIHKSLTVPMFRNNYYTVQKRFVESVAGPMWHLSIRRNDRKPVHNWTDFQIIKNQLCGPFLEGCELYPSVKREVQFANQYNLYVFMNDDKMFPFGIGPQVKKDDANSG